MWTIVTLLILNILHHKCVLATERAIRPKDAWKAELNVLSDENYLNVSVRWPFDLKAEILILKVFDKTNRYISRLDISCPTRKLNHRVKARLGPFCPGKYGVEVSVDGEAFKYEGYWTSYSEERLRSPWIYSKWVVLNHTRVCKKIGKYDYPLYSKLNDSFCTDKNIIRIPSPEKNITTVEILAFSSLGIGVLIALVILLVVFIKRREKRLTPPKIEDDLEKFIEFHQNNSTVMCIC